MLALNKKSKAEKNNFLNGLFYKIPQFFLAAKHRNLKPKNTKIEHNLENSQ